MTVDLTIDVAAPAIEPVNVLRRADEPAHFLWRGRLYAVRSVRSHWFERRGPGDAAPAGPTPTDTVTASAELPGAGGHTVRPDWELWRVEAASGRMAPMGVFDLCLARPDGEWTLSLVTEQER